MIAILVLSVVVLIFFVKFAPPDSKMDRINLRDHKNGQEKKLRKKIDKY